MKGFVIGLLTATAISLGAAQIGPRPPAGGGGTTIPTSARLAFTTACPTGWTQDAAMADLVLMGTTSAAGNVGGTGGSNNLTPAGSNSAPTFTGNSVASSLVSGGTPAGTNTQPTLTMNAYTPQGTNGTVSFTPAGTNGTVNFTPTGTVAAPTFTGSSSTVGAQTFTGTPFSGVINHTHTVNVTDNGHTHLTQRYPTATGASSGFTIDTSMSGTLADNTLPTKTATTGITAATVNPAGGVASITPAGTNSTSTVTPLGSNSAPAFTGSSGVVPAQTFTGQSGTVSAQAFTGTPATLTGTVSQPSFSGNLLATHQHATTATGSVTAPTFSGDVADNRSAFVRVIWCRVSGPEPAPAQVAAVDPMPWWGLPLAGLIGILAGVGFRRV